MKLVPGCILAPHFWERVVSYRLYCDIALYLTIQLQFAIKCLRLSNPQWVGHFGAKFGEERVDRRKLNFDMIWERRAVIGLSYATEIVLIYSAV